MMIRLLLDGDGDLVKFASLWGDDDDDDDDDDDNDDDDDG